MSAARSSIARRSPEPQSNARVAAISPRLQPIVSPESFKGRAYTALKDAIVAMDVYRHRADIWLDDAFRSWSIEQEVTHVDVPMLVIQGKHDEYGTLDQLDRIARNAKVDIGRLVLSQCGHSPHRDQETVVIDAMAAFAGGLQDGIE